MFQAITGAFDTCDGRGRWLSFRPVHIELPRAAPESRTRQEFGQASE